MMAPPELLDISIGHIRTLTAFLREQLGEGSGGSESETAESRACNEILAYLTVVVLRLEAQILISVMASSWRVTCQRGSGET